MLRWFSRVYFETVPDETTLLHWLHTLRPQTLHTLTAEMEPRLSAAGVKLVAIPAAGPLSQERQTLEHSRSFKRGYRWRAGSEGRIVSLRRDYGWRKCGYHGQDGMQRWLALGVIASNLRHLARVKAS